MFEENGGGELEACLKTKLGDRLRALQVLLALFNAHKRL